MWSCFLKLLKDKVFTQPQVLVLARVSRFGVKGFGPKRLKSLK